VPDFLKGIVAHLFSSFGQKRTAMLVKAFSHRTATEYFEFEFKLREFQRKVIEFWEKEELYCVISPAFACPAIKHGFSKYLLLGFVYTSFWNCVDFPCGNLPVTEVYEHE
jgi:fatty acid amide hydrolase